MARTTGVFFAHEVKAINNEEKDPHAILLSKKRSHTISAVICACHHADPAVYHFIVDCLDCMGR